MDKTYITLLHLAAFTFKCSFCMLPNEERSLDDVFQQYFNLGYTIPQMAGLFLFIHHIIINQRTIKRIMRRLNLRRRDESRPEDIARAILQLHREGYLELGYRAAWRMLFLKYGIRAHQTTIRITLRALDPTGVNNRIARRLRRRVYVNNGPNFIIHVDGYDKLKPFGISIHGAIYGFSRKILWLKAASSNKSPRFVAFYFMQYIRKLGRVPRMVRVDAGTENCTLENLQIALRVFHTDSMSGYNSVSVGRSTGNQRIEMLLSFLKRNFTFYWRNFFKDMIDENIFHNTDQLHIECLRLCFMPLIQTHLDNFKNSWNIHTIRSQRNNECVTSKPNILYYQPMMFGGTDCSFEINCSNEDIETLEEVYTEKPPEHGCSVEMVQLSEMLTGLSADFFQELRTAEQAKFIYQKILLDVCNLRRHYCHICMIIKRTGN